MKNSRERRLSAIKIERVVSKKDFKTFLLFPWKVYRGDPNWVPPLLADVKEKLDRQRNPFFEHAEMALFLAHREGKCTGRIAAIVDKNHNDFHQEKVVFFGMYESLDDPDTACALLNEAARWGRERGMNVLRGPMNLSMNEECAFLLEGFDSPPAIMMPYNPRYYPTLMEGCGLAKAKDLFAFIMNRDHRTADKVEAVVQKIRQETKFNLRPIDLKNIKEEAKKIKEVYNRGWEKNWGFVPWTEPEMEHMTKKLKQLADPQLIILAERQGKPVGFAFGLPNYNEVLIRMNGRLTPFGLLTFLRYRRRIKSMRALVFGLVKEYHNSGLSYLLYSELEKNARARGYQWGELSWQLEDNDAVNKFAFSVGAKIYKKYRIFERPAG